MARPWIDPHDMAWHIRALRQADKLRLRQDAAIEHPARAQDRTRLARAGLPAIKDKIAQIPAFAPQEQERTALRHPPQAGEFAAAGRFGTGDRITRRQACPQPQGAEHILATMYRPGAAAIACLGGRQRRGRVQPVGGQLHGVITTDRAHGQAGDIDRIVGQGRRGDRQRDRAHGRHEAVVIGIARQRRIGICGPLGQLSGPGRV